MSSVIPIIASTSLKELVEEITVIVVDLKSTEI